MRCTTRCDEGEPLLIRKGRKECRLVVVRNGCVGWETLDKEDTTDDGGRRRERKVFICVLLHALDDGMYNRLDTRETIGAIQSIDWFLDECERILQEF